MTDTRRCECGRRMIRRFSNTVLLTYPPQYPWRWWCGGCGREEEGGTEHGLTEEAMALEEWRRANGLAQ